MGFRSIAMLIFALALLALGGIAVACGGGDDALSLEDYLAELDSLDAQYEERTDALEVWAGCYSDADRAEYIRRNPDLFYFTTWGEVRANVRGESFRGCASELLA